MSKTELERILRDIEKNTGTEVSLTPHGGEETAFSLEYCGERYTAYLNAKGAEAEHTAKLVSYLVAQSDALPDRAVHLRNILLGEGNRQYARRYLLRCGLKDLPCYALELILPRRTEEALPIIESCIADTGAFFTRMADDRIALVIPEDETQLPVELGNFLVQSLYEELGLKAGVGIGCVMKSFEEIARSYAQADAAVRMSELLKSDGQVHTYREYLLVKLLEDIPEGRLKEHMEEFRITGAEEVFADEEMMGTAEMFLENSLNLSETARELFLHRNTLMYRLDKLERLTGLNIRNFSDAVTFRVMTILYRLLKGV